MDTFPEDVSLPILKKLDKDSSSKRSLDFASSYLRNCLENHGSCNRSLDSWNPPKRLINVGSQTRDPFLVEIPPALRKVEWLSLSYFWGEEPSMKLTKGTINTLRNGIALSRLDPTIRDAIFVTRALGIPYIWIDALCIVQDSNGGGWNGEASGVHEIYGGATVTLVIASSSSVKCGFLKERQTHYIHVPSWIPGMEDAGTESSAQVYLSPEWDKKEDTTDGPWSMRGWTMQEDLLSSRQLCCTSSQVIWKCSEEERFERGVTKNSSTS